MDNVGTVTVEDKKKYKKHNTAIITNKKTKTTEIEEWPKIAILYDRYAKYSPSNRLAIHNFCVSALKYNLYPVVIRQKDLHQLEKYKALLIRDTTALDDYTYKFALYAQMLNIVCLDNTYSIALGCDKIKQIYKFEEHNISYPETAIITNKWINNANEVLGYPVVIKVANSCFSRGVYLTKNKDEYDKITRKLLADHPKIIAQRFIKTDFDWRIGVLDKQIFFACKYYMTDNDWKIVKYNPRGKVEEGLHQAVAINKVPECVLNIAKKCLKILDDGLYGIDIKQTGENCHVIEINDNPNLDAGVEDGEEKNQVYDFIMQYFAKKLQELST